jgi:hypothetical protein
MKYPEHDSEEHFAYERQLDECLRNRPLNRLSPAHVGSDRRKGPFLG